MFKIEEPISWNIRIEPVCKGSERYCFDYVEVYPNGKERLHGAKALRELVSRHPLFTDRIKVIEKDENIEIRFVYVGEKQIILDMMAGEFLGFSVLGKQSLLETLGKLTVGRLVSGGLGLN